RGQTDSHFKALSPKELMRHLNQDAGAISGIGLGAFRAAMQHVDQNLKRLANDVVRLTALYVNNEPDAAAIVLELRIIQALFGRDSRYHTVHLPTSVKK